MLLVQKHPPLENYSYTPTDHLSHSPRTECSCRICSFLPDRIMFIRKQGHHLLLLSWGLGSAVLTAPQIRMKDRPQQPESVESCQGTWIVPKVQVELCKYGHSCLEIVTLNCIILASSKMKQKS